MGTPDVAHVDVPVSGVVLPPIVARPTATVALEFVASLTSEQIVPLMSSSDATRLRAAGVHGVPQVSLRAWQGTEGTV